MAKTDLTAARLRELLDYNPETGVFTRLVSTCGKVKVGDVAGSTNPTGYREIRVLGKTRKAHRLAWLYMTGEWPTYDIDHINGIKTDNRYCNLRDVTKSENKRNTRIARADGTSGYLGVYNKGSKWQSKIFTSEGSIHLGTFSSPELAHAAYVAAKRKFHSTCTI